MRVRRSEAKGGRGDDSMALFGVGWMDLNGLWVVGYGIRVDGTRAHGAFV